MNHAESDNIMILGASENNLKHIDVTIPKGKLVVFAGVSGSGKSSLAFDTVAVESSREWQQSYPLFLRNKMPHYERPKVDEIRNLTPAIVVDQHAIGATWLFRWSKLLSTTINDEKHKTKVAKNIK